MIFKKIQILCIIPSNEIINIKIVHFQIYYFSNNKISNFT